METIISILLMFGAGIGFWMIFLFIGYVFIRISEFTFKADLEINGFGFGTMLFLMFVLYKIFVS